MKVTLKKASRMDEALKRRIDEIFRGVQESQSTSIYADVVARRNKTREENFAIIERVRSLLEIRQRLRALVGAANAAQGVSDLLTNRSYLQDLVNKLETLAVADPGLLDQELADEIQGRKKSFEVGAERYSAEAITFGAFLQSDVDQFKTDVLAVRRDLAELEGELTALNNTSEIELPDNDTVLLREEGIA